MMEYLRIEELAPAARHFRDRGMAGRRLLQSRRSGRGANNDKPRSALLQQARKELDTMTHNANDH